jgi:hypothetical protein
MAVQTLPEELQCSSIIGTLVLARIILEQHADALTEFGHGDPSDHIASVGVSSGVGLSPRGRPLVT